MASNNQVIGRGGVGCAPVPSGRDKTDSSRGRAFSGLALNAFRRRYLLDFSLSFWLRFWVRFPVWPAVFQNAFLAGTDLGNGQMTFAPFRM
ncbi:hypothetical protein CWO90_38280 [Bradyrhizobium sp. Leo121]|nr:hypothetical protein CWO90_38280 [Bradyrhizobium sp. Leo121]